MNEKEIREILEIHKKWLNDKKSGERAHLHKADLSGADLSYADLSGADLSNADLSKSDLRRADLCGANLSNADLCGADLSNADLSYANLSYADLSEANLSNADLSKSDLRRADLCGANLSGVVGLMDAIEYISEHFERCDEGIIVYKIFNRNYAPPSSWKIKKGAIIKEVVNFDRTLDCACGVNVATKRWIHCELETWKCLIKWEWLVGVCVPYSTDGKIRASKVKLLERIS
jgi:hypothetical protein